MAKVNKYQFWLKQGKDKLRLPVLPGELKIGCGSQNDTVNIAGLGELKIIQDAAAETFDFESFFPAKSSPLCDYSEIPKPWDAVKKIKKFKNSGKPTQFIVTGTPINISVAIEEFPHSEGSYDIGDIVYSLSLTEYKHITARKVTKENKNKKKTRPSDKDKPKVYTVKKGDTLWAIARKHYGKGIEWKRIWAVKSNKDMLIKRDKRNLKQPGHWIYPGQKIKLPSKNDLSNTLEAVDKVRRKKVLNATIQAVNKVNKK